MATYHVQIIDGQPTFPKPLSEILAEIEHGGAIQILSPLQYHTDRQRRWWKGVLLPALAKDTGESASIWEARLKLAVLPDDFAPEYVTVNDRPYASVPSITKLGKKKMTALIDGAIDQLHSWGFTWVVSPDAELRK
ncbi:MAG: hypothetical protein KAV00_07025 [Phycisphaerae bacterium]|nr:hypothetical protein [Phycisphaerae bacterium]